MALTAQELIVIGRGKLIAQSTTEEFIHAATENTVKVRSPHLSKLRDVLAGQGVVMRDDADSIVVSGLESAQIGEIAAANQVVLHELSPQRGSLEEAFMQLTGDSVEYHTDIAEAADQLLEVNR
jgi:ABC-2 type transport system ATP-binding protein